ncbi:MAG: glycosyltransferase family 2 protein [Anaerolineae bacterium]|nr:glycosyltransferase family 2 protein [Anaerolineae bacterium]
MTPQPYVTVVIVNWNTREMLAQCLDSIADSGWWPVDDGYREVPFKADVIVVDNASSDRSVEMVRDQYPNVQLIENNENVGFARGNNQALQEAQGYYVMLLNSDAELTSGALEALVAYIDAHPDVGAVGPYLLNGDGATLQPSCHPVLTPRREFWRLCFLDRIWPQATYPMHRWDPATPREVEVIKGACLVLRREALDQVGLLDEQYFMYSEEMDLCYRLSQAGWKLVWVPEARVIHHGEASSKQMAERMYIELYRSKVQFHRKFGGNRRARLFKALVALAYLPRALIASAAGLLTPTLRSRARTYRRLLRTLPGL